MTPDFSKQFLIDAFRGRIAKNDDRPLSEPGDLAEVIVEEYKTHEIVAMLRDGDAFKEGIEFADALLEDLQEVENLKEEVGKTPTALTFSPAMIAAKSMEKKIVDQQKNAFLFQ